MVAVPESEHSSDVFSGPDVRLKLVKKPRIPRRRKPQKSRLAALGMTRGLFNSSQARTLDGEDDAAALFISVPCLLYIREWDRIDRDFESALNGH